MMEQYSDHMTYESKKNYICESPRYRDQKINFRIPQHTLSQKFCTCSILRLIRKSCRGEVNERASKCLCQAARNDGFIYQTSTEGSKLDSVYHYKEKSAIEQCKKQPTQNRNLLDGNRAFIKTNPGKQEHQQRENSRNHNECSENTQETSLNHEPFHRLIQHPPISPSNHTPSLSGPCRMVPSHLRPSPPTHRNPLCLSHCIQTLCLRKIFSDIVCLLILFLERLNHVTDLFFPLPLERDKSSFVLCIKSHPTYSSYSKSRYAYCFFISTILKLRLLLLHIQFFHPRSSYTLAASNPLLPTRLSHTQSYHTRSAHTLSSKTRSAHTYSPQTRLSQTRLPLTRSSQNRSPVDRFFFPAPLIWVHIGVLIHFLHFAVATQPTGQYFLSYSRQLKSTKNKYVIILIRVLFCPAERT